MKLTQIMMTLFYEMIKKRTKRSIFLFFVYNKNICYLGGFSIKCSAQGCNNYLLQTTTKDTNSWVKNIKNKNLVEKHHEILKGFNYNWEPFFKKVPKKEIDFFLGKHIPSCVSFESKFCFIHIIKIFNNKFETLRKPKIKILKNKTFQNLFDQYSYKWLFSMSLNFFFGKQKLRNDLIEKLKECNFKPKSYDDFAYIYDIPEWKNNSEKINNMNPFESKNYLKDFQKLPEEKYKLPKNISLENPETIWIFNEYYHSNVPIGLQVSGTINQIISENRSGDLHGPDFILNDNIRNKTVGLEIFELNRSIFSTSADKIRDMKKYEETITSNYYNRQNNLLKTLFEEIDKKIIKWDKYQKTDIKMLGVIVNNAVPDFFYFVLNLFFSIKNSKYYSFFDKILLL